MIAQVVVTLSDFGRPVYVITSSSRPWAVAPHICDLDWLAHNRSECDGDPD